MSDFPGNFFPPLTINTWSGNAAIVDARSMNLSPNGANASWIGANTACYIPVTVPYSYPVARVFWGNGSAGTGTCCFGIYSTNGTRIYTTGLVNTSGASALQYFTVSGGMIVGPGNFYFALSMDATTNRGWLSSSVTTTFGRQMGMYQQATAHPLPATMTPAAWASTGYQLYGLSVN